MNNYLLIIFLLSFASLCANKVTIENYASQDVAVQITWHKTNTKVTAAVPATKSTAITNNGCIATISFWKNFTYQEPKQTTFPAPIPMPVVTAGTMIDKPFTFGENDCPSQFVITDKYQVTVIGKFKASPQRGQSYKKPEVD